MESSTRIPQFLQERKAEDAIADALPPVKIRRGVTKGLFWGAFAVSTLVKTTFPANVLLYAPSMVARVVEAKKTNSFDKKIEELKTINPDNQLIKPANSARTERIVAMVAGGLFQGDSLAQGILEMTHIHTPSSASWIMFGSALLSTIFYISSKVSENDSNAKVRDLVAVINKRKEQTK